MDQQTRRVFLGRTLLAGAGATLLHSVPAGADPDVRPFDPAIDLDPGFVAGKVSAVHSGGTLSITDLDGQNREVRLDSGSRAFQFGVRVRECGPTVRCVGPQCNGYNVVAYDLTPCAYTAQGKDLASGVQGIQVCLSCP